MLSELKNHNHGKSVKTADVNLLHFSSPLEPAEQRAEQGNIAELSPGAVGGGGTGGGGGGGGTRVEHKAAINSMMMERMNTDIHALKKQYARIKRRQQQQTMQLHIRTGGRKSKSKSITTNSYFGRSRPLGNYLSSSIRYYECTSKKKI